MDFDISGDLANLRDRTLAFVRETIIPYETDVRRGAHGPSDELRSELNEAARTAGLLSPQVDPAYGGLGLSHFAQAVVFEAAGYSMLGPVAMNCAAPDEGNMHLLAAVGTSAQKEHLLRPLAAARTRSCFCMTEPAPGAGSDPSLLTTSAVKTDDGFVLNGQKWLITGAAGAAFAIIMARTVINGVDVGATMFLVDLPTVGFKVCRQIDSIDSSFTGGHAEVVLENLHVGADHVLGEVGGGFRYAQVRLVPARLTHCMRWLGAASRCHDIAKAHAARRTAFGKPLGEHEGVGFMLADNEIDLHHARLGVWHAAWRLDQGERANFESSMVKVHASEACWRVADRALQVLGGLGLTGDTELSRIFTDLRAFRIYDGPSEVHRWSIAKRLQRENAQAAS
jgi:acyl-CoA dehydrogenase